MGGRADDWMDGWVDGDCRTARHFLLQLRSFCKARTADIMAATSGDAARTRLGSVPSGSAAALHCPWLLKPQLCSLSRRHYTRHAHFFTPEPPNPKVGPSNIAILRMRKLRLRETRFLA